MKSAEELGLKPEESLETLFEGLYLIQHSSEFRYGTDAVKLADFTSVKPGDSIMDLCTGTGIIPMLLYHKEPKISKICGLEIQEKVHDMAARSVKLNNLTEKIKIRLGDLREIRSLYPPESFQVVTCNPPYMKKNTGKQNFSEGVAIARHEICCDLSDCAAAAAYLLPSGGKFYMVHRPERLSDVITAMKASDLEPKRLNLISGSPKRPPRLMVIEAQKNRNSGMIVTVETGNEELRGV